MSSMPVGQKRSYDEGECSRLGFLEQAVFPFFFSFFFRFSVWHSISSTSISM